MSAQPVKRRLGRFAVAAATYAAGVVAFTAWTFFAHRATLLAHFDRSLENAAFAAREIVGDGYAESLLLVGSTNSEAYATCQKQLGRFARNGGFSAIGAARRQGGQTFSLVAESGEDGTIPKGDIKPGEPLPPGMATMVLDLATALDDDGVALLTTEHPKYGPLRLAAFYSGKADGTGLAFIVAKTLEPLHAKLRQQAVNEVASGILLLVLAVPLVVLFNRAQKAASNELAELNERLKCDVQGQKTHAEDLEDAIKDLERFNAVTAGRESRVIELKNEVNELLGQLNRAKRYNIDKID